MSFVAEMASGFPAAGRKVGGRKRLSFSPLDPDTPHLRFAVVSILLLWLVVLSTMNMLPKHYVSKATLIVPGASTAVNVALDRIGQTSSAPVSAYNTFHISPKVIYKEMVQSDAVRVAAAQMLDLDAETFGSPRVRLVDETALIHIETTARVADLAQRKSTALIAALQRQLDKLRADELEKRSIIVQENLSGYQVTLDAARAKVARLQVLSGLHSSQQFHELVQSLVQRQRRLADLNEELDRLENGQRVFEARVGMSAKAAARAVQMVGDPATSKLVFDFAEAHGQFNADRRRFGPEHPALILVERRVEAIAEQLRPLLAGIDMPEAQAMQMLARLTNNSHQAELLRKLVEAEAAREGKRAEVAASVNEIDGLVKEQKRLSRFAAELEELTKSVQVAEAVYTTAVARLDTSKSDIYGSYPLLQVLATPSMPGSVAGHHSLFAIAGGLLGTMLLSLAWFLAWLRTDSPHRRLKSA